MSRKGLTDVLTRVALEPDFRSRVHQDPALLDAFDLTEAEKEALRTQDSDALELDDRR